MLMIGVFLGLELNSWVGISSSGKVAFWTCIRKDHLIIATAFISTLLETIADIFLDIFDPTLVSIFLHF